jgi:hypothetical protein
MNKNYMELYALYLNLKRAVELNRRIQASNASPLFSQRYEQELRELLNAPPYEFHTIPRKRATSRFKPF